MEFYENRTLCCCCTVLHLFNCLHIVSFVYSCSVSSFTVLFVYFLQVSCLLVCLFNCLLCLLVQCLQFYYFVCLLLTSQLFTCLFVWVSVYLFACLRHLLTVDFIWDDPRFKKGFAQYTTLKPLYLLYIQYIHICTSHFNENYNWK